MKTIKNINEKTSELGYAFVEVIPRISRLKNANKLNIIAFAVPDDCTNGNNCF